MKKYNLGSLGVFNFVIPVSGAIFSAILLGEDILRLEYCLALGLVVSGIIIINLKKQRKDKGYLNGDKHSFIMKNTKKDKITLPLQAILLAIFCNALFGSVSPILKISYEEFSIGENAFLQIFFAGIRFFVSGVLVFIIASAKNKKVVIPQKENRKNILLVALTYTFLQYVFFYVGISQVKGSIGSVINSLSAFIAVIVAHFIYPNDKLNWQKSIGTCLGFIGVLLALLSGIHDVSFSLWGELFIIIATVCFVIGSVFNKQATSLNDSYVVTAYNLLLGGLGLVVVGLIGGFEQIQTFTFTWKGVLAFLYLVAVSSVGFTIWSILLKKYNLGSLGVFNFVIPVSGAIFSALLLGEDILRLEYCLALLFVVLGIIIINFKKQRKDKGYLNGDKHMNKKLGIFPTMVTPYKKDGNVDYKGVETLVEWYWKKGCDGIFAVCQSSEILFLTLEERVNIGKTVVEKAQALANADKSRKPMKIVVSGHISDSFDDQVEELNAMADVGADALILISNRMDIENTSDEKWIEDLHKLMEKLPKDIPLGVYECPKPYKRLLTKKMLQACKDTGRFAFIKDTCCDAAVIKERVEILKDSNIGLYNANAQTLLETLRAGADGYCGVMANFHPEIYKWMFDNQDTKEADIVQSFICVSAFTESLAYPATAKYYLKAHENIDIEPISRVVDCTLITEYQKSCLAQMKTLGDFIKKEIGIGE